ncbi:CYP2D6 [Bugula neritina]|uniref:CYP2D6 n=1 Tax=Bugula neritina TaxID=10212 RepID=A0A7J7JRP3_BUGNE|nr:CYP2D6 [Bugula neritina]
MSVTMETCVHRDMPGDPTNYHVLMKNASTAMDVLSGVITSHKEKMVENPSSPPADFIDHYLQMMQSGAEPTCTDAQLLAVVTDLFAMGIEATATMLRWALLLLSQHPQVQTRIQKEIDEVMGKTTPSLAHQPEMNFTNSAITEIKRYVNLVSINLPHAATEDAIFQGFFIPKGAVVLPNLASIHYDEETYAEPMTFKPDRFIEGGSFPEA